MSENEIVVWIFILYMVTPVGYCVAAGAFYRRRRGALFGLLVGLATMFVSIAGATQIGTYDLEIDRVLGLLNLPFSPVVFLVQAQATAIVGAFATGWLTRFLQDD